MGALTSRPATRARERPGQRPSPLLGDGSVAPEPRGRNRRGPRDSGGGRGSRWTAVDVPSFARVTRIVATSAHEFAPVISPDGKWIAYLSNARGPTGVGVKFIAGGKPANLTASLDITAQANDNIGGLQISPDSNLIALSATGQGVQTTWVIPAPLGGTPRRGTGRRQSGTAWSPDGTRIAYVRAGAASGDAVWVADADGQHPREVVRPDGGRHAHWLQWSRDGRFVYFNYGPQGYNTEPMEIVGVPSTGGPVEPVVRSMRRAVFPFPDAGGRGLFFAANPDTVDLGLWWRDLSDRTGLPPDHGSRRTTPSRRCPPMAAVSSRPSRRRDISSGASMWAARRRPRSHR